MTTVKKIFFLTEDEAKKIQKETNDPYIYWEVPHYELEDGTIIYGKIGYPASGEVYWQPVKPIKSAK